MPNQTCLQRRAGVRTRGGNGLTTRVLNKGILRGYTPLCLAEKHKRLRPLSLSFCMIGEPERRTAVDPLYDEVAEWLSSTKKVETCMREIMQQVAFVDEATTAAAITPHLQHRIRGALNAAGFESTGRKFSAGDYKGMTKFALVHRELSGSTLLCLAEKHKRLRPLSLSLCMSGEP